MGNMFLFFYDRLLVAKIKKEETSECNILDALGITIALNHVFFFCLFVCFLCFSIERMEGFVFELFCKVQFLFKVFLRFRV